MRHHQRIQIARIRELLYQMERDAGLLELSVVERAILSVMDTLTSHTEDRIVSTDEIRSHVLVSEVAQATFYRALRSLKGKEFITVAPNSRTKSYMLKR